MRRLVLSIVSVFVAFLVGKSQYIKKIDVTEGRLIGVTPALRDLPNLTSPSAAGGPTILMSEKNTEQEGVVKIYSTKEIVDPVLQRNSSMNGVSGNTGELGMNESTVIKLWDGINSPSVSPTDPCMAAGPNHIIQMVNGVSGGQIGGMFRIWDKSGNPLTGNIFMKSISLLPGYGDCVPVYDRIADRWVITEMPDPRLAAPYNIVILVSKTNDPTGQWYIYSFSVNASFPDYPKYSLWTNAYYGTGNNYLNAGAYTGSSVWALERNKLLAGDATAKLLIAELADPDAKFYTMAPVTYQGGPAPAANAPGMFMYISADETTAATTDADSIGLITFLPDFNTPANSVITRNAIAVAPFNAFICSANRGACIMQPGTTVALEALHWKLMHHLVWRDFGTYKTILASQSVNTGGGISGIRWYEFRDNGSGYNVYQQGTYSPDLSHRWMPSISVNSKGEIAIAYMVSDATSVFPSIRFAGRKPSDPLGQMLSFSETTAFAGTASQTRNNRSGDYNDLSVDPVDDSTFWFTSQYYGVPSLFGGYTKILNFDLAQPTVLDAKPTRVLEPSPRLCVHTFLPSFEIGNPGGDTIKTVKVIFNITGAGFTYSDTLSYTGSIAPEQTGIVTATKSVTVPAGGAFNLKVFTNKPNGKNDQVPANDTLNYSFKVFDPQPAPVKEGFESSTFPPANWDVANSSAAYGWQRSVLGSSQGVASAVVRDYRFNGNKASDYLYSPVVQVTNADSVFLIFDRAHVTAKYPGSTSTPLDSLEILITYDCGKTSTSVYKKWGEDLQSIGDPNFPVIYAPTDTVGFRPNTSSQWKKDSVNLTPWVGANNRFQVVFKNTSNNGNNIYLDNINLYSLTLPAKLKQNGYLISPNPFDGWISVRHYLRPVNLRGIEILNAAGQKMWEMNFSGNASSNIQINLSGFAAGMYMMKLVYSNKVITERILKRQ